MTSIIVFITCAMISSIAVGVAVGSDDRRIKGVAAGMAAFMGMTATANLLIGLTSFVLRT